MMRKGKYYADSKDIVPVGGHGSYTIEYNPNIDMYRINREGGVPTGLMGYQVSAYICMQMIKRHIRYFGDR